MAGKAYAFSAQWPVLRAEVREPLRLTLEIEGMGRLTQETRIAVTNPLNVALQPIGDRTLMAKIENRSGQPFAGTVTVTGKGGSPKVGSVPLELANGQTEAVIQMEMDQPLSPTGTLDVTMTSNEGTVTAASALRYSTDLAEGMAANAYVIWAPNQSMTVVAEAPEARPSQRGPVIKVAYNLDAPAKPATSKPSTAQAATAAKTAAPVTLVAVTPKGTRKVIDIAGQPKALVMWVYGDDNGLGALARFEDSTGQVFQNNLQAINWKGWRAMTFPLDDADVWHWGGANDGVIHYPIKWHTLFLFQ
jgi:hypothetical protein